PPPAQTAVEAIADVHDLSGLRIGYSTDLVFGTNDAGVQANSDRAVSVLEQLGATVEKVDLGWDDPVWAYHVIWFAGADVVVRALGDGAEDKVDPLLLEALERHRGFTASDFVGATALRM